MLAADRQARIAQLVEEQDSVRVTELVDLFGVSDMTIRRDLDLLAGQRTVRKVHGGAVKLITGSTDEPAFLHKADRMENAKKAIALRAETEVEPGMSIALSAGTTTWVLAQRLVHVENLTVVTNSTRISDVFHGHWRNDRSVILTGGVRTPSDALVGPTAVASLAAMNVDMAFLGAYGLTVEAGCTTPNYWEADTNRALLSAAGRSVIVADHTKWGVTGMMTFADLNSLDLLITDEEVPAAARKRLHETGAEVVLATPDALIG